MSEGEQIELDGALCAAATISKRLCLQLWRLKATKVGF